jgi:cobalamin biosynthesis Mg chelatase CobN
MVKMQMTRDQKDQFWWKYRERVARLDTAHQSNVWNPSQSALCGWCPVKSCEFNPKH